MNKKAFTLIELIVVIAIIAVLALIIIPSVTDYIENSQTSVCNENFRQIQNDYLLQSVSNDNLTLSDILNQYRTEGDETSNKKICPLCSNITVTEIDGYIEILSCKDNNNILIDNSNIILVGFMDNLNYCLATREGNFSDDCAANYTGKPHYLNDSTMRSLLLEDLGGTWPEINPDVLTQINSQLTEAGLSEFEGLQYIQTKFIAPEDNEINYFNFLATDDTGWNSWKTKLIYDPIGDKYYATADGNNFNVAPYHVNNTTYEEFLEILNSDTFIEIDLN